MGGARSGRRDLASSNAYVGEHLGARSQQARPWRSEPRTELKDPLPATASFRLFLGLARGRAIFARRGCPDNLMQFDQTPEVVHGKSSDQPPQ